MAWKIKTKSRGTATSEEPEKGQFVCEATKYRTACVQYKKKLQEDTCICVCVCVCVYIYILAKVNKEALIKMWSAYKL
jgi:hypothetical protein